MEWTKERLAEAKARCEAATPGPWGWTPGSGDAEDADECACVQSADGSMEIEAGDKEPSFFRDADAAFIAAARTDLPDALAEIERVTAKLAGIEGIAAESDGMIIKISELAAEIERLKRQVDNAENEAMHAQDELAALLAPAASDAARASHVSIPRAVLEKIVDAAARDESVREARETAERVLHLDLLRHEPARTDPEAARAMAAAAPHDRYLHDGPRETCPLPSCATPDPPAPADPLDDLPEGERNRILDLAAEAHRKAFGFGDAASAAYDDVIRREVTAYHARDPRCPDSGCEHPDHTRADEERGR